MNLAYDAELDPDAIHVFTDGALSRDCGTGTTFGGWSAYMQYDTHSKSVSGGILNKNIDIIEFEAIRQALLILTNVKGRRVFIYCDNLYCVGYIVKYQSHFKVHNNYHKRTRCIVKSIISLLEPNIYIRWIKGHSGIEGNDKADALAVAARCELRAQWEIEQEAKHATNQDAVWSRVLF